MVTKLFTVVMRGNPPRGAGIETRIAAGIVEFLASYAARRREPGDEFRPGQLAQRAAAPLFLERMDVGLPGHVSLQHAVILPAIGQHSVKPRFTVR
jgi:hypothetical protein